MLISDWGLNNPLLLPLLPAAPTLLEIRQKCILQGLTYALTKLFKAPKAKVAKAPTRLENPWLAMELKNASYNNLRVFALSANFDLWLSAGT